MPIKKSEDYTIIDKNVRKIGNKYFGKCVICEKEKELTREHVPPRCAFNKYNFDMTDGFDLMTSDTLPWENTENIKTTIIQGGLYYYAMCKDCNTKMGSLYTRAYKNFVSGLHSIFANNEIQTNDYVEITKAKIKPLNIYKQIVSMFNTLNPDFFQGRNFNVGKFLLDKEDNNFCKDVHFYIFLSRNVHKVPLQIQGYFDGQKFVAHFLSEIVHYPLGIIMSVDKELDKEACIDSFLTFKYNEEIEADMNLFVRERNLPTIGDYRTQQQISEDAKKDALR